MFVVVHDVFLYRYIFCIHIWICCRCNFVFDWGGVALVGDRPYNAERANWFNTHIRTIHETNRAFDPTHFVLNFPCGTDGWSKGMRKRPLGLCPVVNGRPFSYWNPYACVWEDVIGTRCTVLPSAPSRNEHQVSTRSFYAYRYAPHCLCRLFRTRAPVDRSHAQVASS